MGCVDGQKGTGIFSCVIAASQRQIAGQRAVQNRGVARNQRGQRRGIFLGQVDFPGWVSPPVRLLSQLDLFVCSSRTESFGLVVIEAMAAGAPVVATDIEGPRILLGEGRYGRLVAPEAPAALAEAMAAALDDPQASLDMARLAQAEAIAAYDMDAGGRRLWTALIALLEGR